MGLSRSAAFTGAGKPRSHGIRPNACLDSVQGEARTMPNHSRQPIASGLVENVIPVLMCRDVSVSIEFFCRHLGFSLSFQDAPADPRYAGISRGPIELHLQWMDADQFRYPIDQPNYRFAVADVDVLHGEFSARDVNMTAVMDTPWGTREFHLRDPGGNGLQFFQRSKR